jgi:type IV pilus assembly protein PilP
MKSIQSAFLGMAMAAALAGCGGEGVEEIQAWMSETKSQTRVVNTKIPEPKKFIPFTYEANDKVDPYNPMKLEVALAKALAKPGNNSLKPDLERRREPLENFPLDTVKMVGTLNKKSMSFALLQVDKVVYQAKVGNYVGQNFGMITDINETEIQLKEIVQDAAGDWVERKAKLELQETTK